MNLLTGLVLPCGPLTVVDEVVWAGGCQSIAAAGRFDFSTSEMTQAVFKGFVGDAVVSDDAVWFANAEIDGAGKTVTPRLVGLDPVTGKEVATASLDAGSDVAIEAADSFWVAAPGALLRIPLNQLVLP